MVIVLNVVCVCPIKEIKATETFNVPDRAKKRRLADNQNVSRATIMEPRSNTLFHFTKTKEKLFQILLYGFWPRYVLEDTSWFSMVDNDCRAFPMVCFCDIPLSRISEHISFYGSYGIGLSKRWAEENGMNPLFYISPRSNLDFTLFDNIAITLKGTRKDNKKETKNNIRYLLSHIKPTKGKMRLKRKIVEKEFYQESEWRYVPLDDRIKMFLNEVDYHNENELEKLHKETKEHCSLKFNPTDVSFIFVPKDKNIPSLIMFMQSKLNNYSDEELKVLFSRVISIENILKNI